MIQEEEAHYYIYSQTWRGRTQTGITAVASIDDYESGVIRRHENTREEKEKDRIAHVEACGAQTGPIFLTYPGDRLITEMTERCMRDAPICDFESAGGVRNRVWVIRDSSANRLIARRFAQIPRLYIADGHHRCASAVKVGLRCRERAEQEAGHPLRGLESDYFLCVLFPAEQLEILPYHRVLKTDGGHSVEDILRYLEERFTVEGPFGEPVQPQCRAQFGMLLGGVWYRLTARDSVRNLQDPVEALDVSLLQREILRPLFGIEDPRCDPGIDFVGGIRGTEELERRCQEDACCAFAMAPTSIGELLAVADAGRLMPPKSTWFEPKLLSGLFIHLIN